MHGLLAHLAASLDPTALAVALGITLDAWQAAAMLATQKGYRGLWCCSRQSGKTLTASLIAAHVAIYTPGSLVLAVAPAQRQSLELLYKTREHCAKLGVELIGDSATRLEFTNGSRIFALPGSEATTRGFSAPNLILLDEASRIDDALISSLTPMLATSNGAMVAMTTPAGKRGWFYETWRSGGGWQKVAITAAEVPRISKEFLETARREMTAQAFAAEYECQFVDDGASAFPTDLIQACLTSKVTRLWPEVQLASA